MSGISPEDKRDLILSVGIHKTERPLSPIEVAELLEKLISSGTTKKEISKEILLDSTMISRFLRLSNLAPEIQHLVSWGGESRISFSTASEIARLKTSEEHRFLAKGTLEHELSKSEVIQIIEVRNKFGKPIDECVEEILKMRPRIIKRYLFVGAVKSSDVQDRLSEMPQEERNVLFKKAVTSNYPDLPYWEGLLGIKGFNLIGSEDLDQVLSKLPTDFESTINDYLKSRILGNEQSTD